MQKPIRDELFELPLTKQQKYKIRKFRRGICRNCTQPLVTGSHHCIKCLCMIRESTRTKQHFGKRYPHAKSYWLEDQAFVRQILSESDGNQMGEHPRELAPAHWNVDFLARTKR